ncbi:MAG TPA: TonB-dependent receptor [Vicinamibacterales bacterium]|nr:TonB-dependent receptor [Vicinamibacterales bacterium]
MPRPAAAALCVLLPSGIVAQGLTGTLTGTVTDEQDAAIAGALVQLSSPALIGGPAEVLTNARGQWRFAVLPPGSYSLDVAFKGFARFRETGISIGAGAAIDIPVRLQLAGRAESVLVEGPGARFDARNPGFGTRFGPEELRAIPTPRASMFNFLRMAPGISPTSPAGGTATTVSAFGSGTNENQYLIDGNNFTCPCNGIARSEPGIDFMQGIQIQSVGASAEYGNVQGAVINVVTRQGGDRFLHDASYYLQTAGLTSQPVRLPYGSGGTDERLLPRQVPRLHDEPRRPRSSEQAVVLCGIRVSARLRHPAGRRPGVLEDLRTEQDRREGDVEAGSRLAARPKPSL